MQRTANGVNLVRSESKPHKDFQQIICSNRDGMTAAHDLSESRMFNHQIHSTLVGKYHSAAKHSTDQRPLSGQPPHVPICSCWELSVKKLERCKSAFIAYALSSLLFYSDSSYWRIVGQKADGIFAVGFNILSDTQNELNLNIVTCCRCNHLFLDTRYVILRN